MFEVVDQELYQLQCELEEKYKTGTLYAPPTPYNDPTTRLFWDLEISGAWVLSKRGQQMFADGLDVTAFSQLWEETIFSEVSEEGKTHDEEKHES